MRSLLLLRHASTESDASGGDVQRYLTDRGEREALGVGSRFTDAVTIPSLILHSTARRAARTTELLLESAAGCLDGAKVRGIDGLYLASPKGILEVIAGESCDHTTVLIVAHNPGLSDLTNLLMNSADDDAITAAVLGFRPATLMHLSFDTPSWGDLLGRGHVEACTHP